MDASTRNRALSYETPHRSDDVVVVSDGGELRVELGPVSSVVLVTQIASWAIGIAGLAAALMYFGNQWRNGAIKLWLVVPVAVAVDIFMIVSLAHRRRSPRIFVVRRGTLLYSNATTGDRLLAVPPEKTKRIVVRRCWWRPWMCQLDADPAVGFLSRKRGNQTSPQTMAFDTDRSKLERVAGELRRGLGIV